MDSTMISFRSHTALLLAAALPYLQPAYRQPAELALKFMELSETWKLYQEIPKPGIHTPKPQGSPKKEGLSGILDFVGQYIQDPEGLLHSLIPFCVGKEKDIIVLLLNLMQAKNFYENYGDLLQTFLSSDMGQPHEAPSSPAPDADDSFADGFSMPDLASMMSGGDLSSMMSQEQTDTLNLLKHLLDAE